MELLPTSLGYMGATVTLQARSMIRNSYQNPLMKLHLGRAYNTSMMTEETNGESLIRH